MAEDNVFVYGAILTAKKIGYLKDSLYNYVIHEKSAIRTKSDKNFCFFKSLDSVKKMLQNLGLQQELKNEFDSYILRIVSFHMKQIKSLDKFWQTCNKKLTPFQYSMLRERYNANQKLLPIIKSIINKK